MRRNTNQHIYVLVAVAVAVLCAGSTASAQYTLSTLAAFNGDSDGVRPAAALIADASGNLYGTTLDGGPDGSGGYEYGTVFEVSAGTHAISTLATFIPNRTSGNTPWSRLLADSDGNLYGTTKYGATNNEGVVYEVAAGTHALSTLAAFNSPTTGGYSQAGLIADSSGNLYGTTTQGGANGYGTVFQVAAGTHSLNTLASFTAANGEYTPFSGSYGDLIADAGGNLYGTTFGSAAGGYGTVFEVAAGTHALITLATFNGLNGANPEAGLVADANGNLYGTTSVGGANGYGTVFKVAAGTHTLSTLFSFSGGNALFAQATEGSLIIGPNGNLFGTTPKGGSSNDGIVFELDPNTLAFTILATFDGTNGQYPEGGLLADANGDLYGTARGGPDSFSTVFELSPVPEPSSIMLAGPTFLVVALLAELLCRLTHARCLTPRIVICRSRHLNLRRQH